jgi:AcrR family transcriptional regulator
MPYPAQVDRETLIETARQMIEEAGSADDVSLALLAARFGIKAPSLYRHVQNKAELLQAVNLITLQDMGAFLAEQVEAAPPNAHDRVLAMGKAYRAFAFANPVTYELAFASSLAFAPDQALVEVIAINWQKIMAELVGEAKSLNALRGAWAMLHGFAMLEIQGRFQREGTVESAFLESFEAYIKGWEG